MLSFDLMGAIDIIAVLLLFPKNLNNLITLILIFFLLLRGISSFVPILPTIVPLFIFLSLLDIIVAFLFLLSYGFSNLIITILFFYFLIKGIYSIVSFFLFR
ncbi:hypothetical protein DRN73_06775 [Candidatus Pacearchaeota archaeon]|nr:MAG: hypothetical protein DRN73_06775 [Candidatus Pacearchaeota archaeon]